MICRAPLALAATCAALLCAGLASAGDSSEARCVELGSDCFCSEPLNFSYSGDIAFTGSFFDPPDSEGAGAKECNGGTQAVFKSGGSAQVVAGSTVGLSGLDYVFQFSIASSGNRGNIRSAANTDLTDGTYCQRAYQRYSDAGMEPHPDHFGDDDVKGMDSDDCDSGSDPCGFLAFNWFPGSMRLFGSTSSTGINGTPFYLDAGGSQISPVGGTTVTFDKCVDGWCRLEFCYDHNLDGDDRMHYRGRIVALIDGTTQTWGPEKSEGSNATAVSGGRSFPSQLLCDRGDPPHDTNCDNTQRWFTHVMVAKLSVADGDFWIGPAEEIEGAGAGSSTGSWLGVGGSGWGTQ